MVAGCDHIGIQVRDVERSARFYEENLGFQRVEDRACVFIGAGKGIDGDLTTVYDY